MHPEAGAVPEEERNDDDKHDHQGAEMFDLRLCALITLVLGVGTWLDARRQQPLWRLPTGAWVTLVAVTWVAVLPYAVGRVLERRPTVSVR